MAPQNVGSALFDNDFLDELRTVGDPPADDVIAPFIDRELGAQAGGLMKALIAREPGSLNTDETSPILSDFINDRPPFPSWVDTEMVDRGQALFANFVPQLGLGLWMGSLPAGYAGERGAQVLTHTARLVSDPKRRFLETGQFIIDVMTPGGLAPDATGARDIRHVRLMHAAVRHLLTHPSDLPEAAPFDVAKLGVPINQEDLLGTMFTFSLIGLQVLERGGVRITDDDAESYVHTWNLIGHLMGIRDDLLPLNRTDAATVFLRIQARNYAESDAGKELTAAAIEVMQEFLGLRALRGVPAAGIRAYLGNDIAKLLGVPRVPVTRLAFLPPRWFNWWSYKMQKDSRLARAVAERLGRRLFRGFLDYEREGEARPTFEVTDALEEQLGLT